VTLITPALRADRFSVPAQFKDAEIIDDSGTLPRYSREPGWCSRWDQSWLSIWSSWAVQPKKFAFTRSGWHRKASQQRGIPERVGELGKVLHRHRTDWMSKASLSNSAEALAGDRRS
jgi:hypothetical protein